MTTKSQVQVRVVEKQDDRVVVEYESGDKALLEQLSAEATFDLYLIDLENAVKVNQSLKDGDVDREWGVWCYDLVPKLVGHLRALAAAAREQGISVGAEKKGEQ